MKYRKMIALTLIVAMMIPMLNGCSLLGIELPDLFGGGSDAITVSQEEPVAESESLGVKVEFSPFLLEDGEELEVQIENAGTLTADNGDWKIDAYEISAGDLHDLGTYIEIRLPYTDDFCAEGSDPAKCVAAKYLNEETNQWEDVLYTVDAENHEVVITTDHFSYYGCFYVSNEGLRSAYISDVDDSAFIPDNLALSALSEWAQTGQAGDNCYKIADIYLEDLFKDVALKSAGDAFDYTGNLLTVTQMSDFQFDSKSLSTFNTKFGKAIGKLGKVAAAANIAYTMCNSDKTPEDVMGMYKDCLNFALSFSEEAAMGISMVGVWVIDKSLFTFGQEVQNMRIATVAPIYRYFNDKFDGNSDNYKGQDKARTSIEWLEYLKKLAKATKGDQETFKIMLEQEVDSYARRWFNLPLTKQEDYAVYISTIVKSGTSASSYWYSALSNTEKENMITAYKGELYDRLIPMMNKVQLDFQKDLEKERLKTLKEIQNMLNAKSDVTIHEVVEGDATPSLEGYIIRFADLNDKAEVKNWTGKLDKNGSTKTNFTGVAWLMVGGPNKLNIYEPDADPDTDKPIQSVPFTYTFGNLDIPIVPKLYPTIEEICGTWDCLATITAVDAPEELMHPHESDDESGCDIDLSKLVGEENETEMTFVQTGETTFNLTGGEDTVIPMTYDQKTGIATGGTTEDEATITLNLQFNYDDAKETVLMDGTLQSDMLAEGQATGIKITAKILGNKGL